MGTVILQVRRGRPKFFGGLMLPVLETVGVVHIDVGDWSST
jgi:hypothetical protein